MTNKQFVFMTLVAIMAGLAGALIANQFQATNVIASSASRPVKASAFMLVDDKGATRAGLYMREQGPAFYFADGLGRTTLEIYTTVNGPTINIKDEAGNPRIELGFDIVNNPRMQFLDQQNRPRCRLGFVNDSPDFTFDATNGETIAHLLIDENQHPFFILNKPDDKTSIGLGAQKVHTGLYIVGAKGALRSGLSYSRKRGTVLTFKDSENIDRMELGLTPKMNPHLFMVSKEHKNSLRMMVTPYGSFADFNEATKKPSSSFSMGVVDNIPLFSLVHSDGSYFNAMFSKLGQPYLELSDRKKVVWSMPNVKPPGLKLFLPDRIE